MLKKIIALVPEEKHERREDEDSYENWLKKEQEEARIIEQNL